METILIADDDKLILATFRRAFERAGYAVLVAENGNQALAHLEAALVDVVFLDILMPEKDGLETLLEIRERFPNVLVYLMTGGGVRGTPDFLETATKFGATGVLRKPVTPAQLVKIIESCGKHTSHPALTGGAYSDLREQKPIARP